MFGHLFFPLSSLYLHSSTYILHLLYSVVDVLLHTHFLLLQNIMWYSSHPLHLLLFPLMFILLLHSSSISQIHILVLVLLPILSSFHIYIFIIHLLFTYSHHLFLLLLHIGLYHNIISIPSFHLIRLFHLLRFHYVLHYILIMYMSLLLLTSLYPSLNSNSLSHVDHIMFHLHSPNNVLLYILYLSSLSIELYNPHLM